MVSMEYEEISKNAGESTAKDENVNASTFFLPLRLFCLVYSLSALVIPKEKNYK